MYRASQRRENILLSLSAPHGGLRILGGGAPEMARVPPLVDTRIVRPAETALALGLVGPADLLRLKTIARLHARGLPPDVSWEDLLQEALTRVLVGTRRQPEGVSMVAFLAGIMRSLKSEHWRRARGRPGSRDALALDRPCDDPREIELLDPSPDPERSLVARQELAAIQRLFEQDTVALQIIAGLGNGLSPEQIRAAYGITDTDYDSARKRMRRRLLREGLTWSRE
jgi:DNA-directed RNA polymerase specialized sigma24 family protein